LAANNDNPRAEKALERENDKAELKAEDHNSSRSNQRSAPKPDGVGNQVDRQA